jgi:diadenosine tetraphosphate (Ap4A) HIT family hydrolase
MTHLEDCVFCSIIDGDGEATILLETDEYLCLLDKYPVTEGHALVAPKEHIQYLEQADSSSLFEFLEEAITEVTHRYDPDATNIGINNGPAAGQTIPHLHWHIIPRYEGDMEDPTGGVRGVIPNKRMY